MNLSRRGIVASGLGLASGLGVVAPAGSSAASPRALCVPLVFNLFGPVQNEGAHVQVGPRSWEWPGAALSASTKRLRFDLRYPPVVHARWVVIWTPGNGSAAHRLVCSDDGPANLIELGSVTGRDRATPLAQELEITDALNALRERRTYKHIGFQVRGDGVTPIKLFRVTAGDQLRDWVVDLLKMAKGRFWRALQLHRSGGAELVRSAGAPRAHLDASGAKHPDIWQSVHPLARSPNRAQGQPRENRAM